MTSPSPDFHSPAAPSGLLDVPEAPAPGIAPEPVSRRLQKILSLEDFEKAAQRFLPRPVFGYIAGAAETNAARQDNRDVFGTYGFLPRTLRAVRQRTTSTILFGHDYAVPFGISPMGLSALAAYRGDIVLAKAAAQLNMPMVISGTSLIRLEDIAAVAPQSWFQAYLPGEVEKIIALLDRVAAAGLQTLVLTVDTSILGNRENHTRNGFSTPLKPSLRLAFDGAIRPEWVFGTFFRTLLQYGMPHFENSYATRGAPVISKSVMRDFGARDHLNWAHAALIRRHWKGRFILKGIMTVEDAKQAHAIGADGIILSNHGGRQLDYTVSPMRVLAAVAEAIGGRIPVMIDSGFRRGSDVMKALALGADFVFVGRPFLYAASVGGEAGVRHCARILYEELHRNMGLIGVNTVRELSPALLHRIDGR